MKELRPVSSLDPALRRLVTRARAARKRAYCPYSRFRVGCAIEDINGKIHTGCNVENASYSAAICAERTAIAKMVSRGVREIRRLVVVTSSSDPVFPCGICLQAIMEFGPKASVIAVDPKGKNFKEAELSDLFPAGFTHSQLRGTDERGIDRKGRNSTRHGSLRDRR